jgi:glutathione peroxidase
MTTAHDFSATTIDGDLQPLGHYEGQVVLVVNTASKCGNTPQYEGLQRLYEKYAERGLAVLGFPCDQFGHQEPGDEAQIKAFCSTTYDVTFPMFAKVDVNGEDAHPLFRWLTHERPADSGAAVEWNFTKFLVAPDGHVVKRYAPKTEPADIVADIEPLLPSSGGGDHRATVE